MSLCYTSFRRPQQITMSNDTLQITESYSYDASYNRVQSIRRLTDLETSRMTMRTSFSLGGCYDNDGVAERLWLGGGYYGAPVVLEVTDTMQYRYVMRDHLGSITHVYTAEPIPTLLQELSYDAWGRLRNPDTHEAYTSDSIPTPILGRGYTGHRHIAGIGLIDMNARLYDPMLGRFLSPDPHIQSPDCPQNYNRYSYCLNNPLKYVDILGLFATKAEALENSKLYPGSRVGYDSERGEWYVAYQTSAVFYGVEYVRFFRGLYTYQYTDESISPSKGSGGSSMPDIIGYVWGAVDVSQSIKSEIIDFAKDRYGIPSGLEKYVKVSSNLSKGVSIIGIAVSASELIQTYIDTGLSTQTLKSALDVGMSVVGFAGLPGAIISGVYFVADAATDGFGLNKQ